MHDFVRGLITEWRRLELPFSGAPLVVAVSGGADSVSLLLAVHDLAERKKLDRRIVAAHFNHKLRGDDSDMDEDFVRQITVKLGIEFAAGSDQVSAQNNVEQNARVARYNFLSRVAINVHADAVLTGHTVNDQAETFLMNLIRGSGVDGLSGMPPVRNFYFDDPPADENAVPAASQLLLVRPLLTWAKRQNTERYCHHRGVEYRYDTMNEDTVFRRVRIRKILLPMLEDLNPNIIDTLANTASLLREGRKTESGVSERFLENELELKKIKGLPQTELYQIIRGWLRAMRGDLRSIQLKHVQAIERLILSQKSGRVAELPGGCVTKTGGKLVYGDNKVEK